MKKIIAPFILMIALTSCGDDEKDKDLGKVAITAAGALGGAVAGNSLTSPENQTMGTVVGGVAGGALGYLAGNALMN